MKRVIHFVVLPAALVCFICGSAVRADTITVDVPELEGLFLHTLTPLVAFFDTGVNFQPLGRFSIEIVATGVPGIGLEDYVPAELLVSAVNVGGTVSGLELLEPTVFGPYGSEPSADEATNYFGWLDVVPYPVAGGRGYITIDTPEEAWDSLISAEIEILSVSVTMEGFIQPLSGCGADVNCDGFIGLVDLDLVLVDWNRYTSDGANLNADINGDGYIGLADLDAILEEWPQSTPPPVESGDWIDCFPEDPGCGGYIGLAELELVLNNWNMQSPPADPRADWNGDGYVGLDDLDIILNNWNAGTPPTSAAAVAPEPATVLCLLGLGAVMGRRFAK